MTSAWTSRPARGDDYEHFARFFAELGVDDPVPDRTHWEAMATRALFLEGPGGASAAYGLATLLDGTGHVYHVVVDPAHRGKGVGGALMRAIAERLRGEGCTRWCLNVKIDNAPALRLYESFGMKRHHRSTSLVLPWDRLPLLPREEGSFEVRDLDPADDAAIEAAWDLAPGLLAHHRRTGDRVLLGLRDRSNPGDVRVGVASFMPTFPGATPFRVARPALAPHLLEGIRPHARPGDDHLKVQVEGDEALRELLLGAGARVRLELYHYRGEIPAVTS